MTVIANWTTFRLAFANGALDLDPDGVESWRLDLVRANGFDDGFTGIPTPIVSFPITISVDGLAVGVEAYDVWLSQRTDDVLLQWLSIVRTPTRSGSWTVSLTAQARDDLALTEGLGSALTLDQLGQVLKDCDLYCRRHSDGAIQHVLLLDATLAVV